MKLPRDKAEVSAHLGEFETWFSERQREAGCEGTALISVEHAILRAYITWLRVQLAKEAHARDQAE